MLSLEECKRILKKSGAKYSDQEVLKIREILYKLAELDLELFKKMEDGTGPNKLFQLPRKRRKKKKSKK